jgi:hypothetical protein
VVGAVELDQAVAGQRDQGHEHRAGADAVTQPLTRPRDLHARADVAIALPVQPDEHVTLGKIGPVEIRRGCGRAPSSNSTGVSRNAEMARDTGTSPEGFPGGWPRSPPPFGP